MSEPRTDPVWLDDIEPPLEQTVPRRLCIISGDALPSGEFIAALQTLVGPNEEIEIIRDRRRGGPGAAPGQPPVERRRLPHRDGMVKMDGFVIVPPATRHPRRRPRVEDPPKESRPIERRPVEPRAVERPRFERPRHDASADADEREFERILQFKRRREARLGPLVLLAALVAVLTVLLIQLPAVKTVMSWRGPAAPTPAEQPLPAPQASSAPESSSPLPRSSASRPQNGASRSPDGAESPEPERLREANSAPPVRADTVSRPQTDRVDGLPPAPPGRASARPSDSVPPSRVLRGEASRFPGLPGVKLERKPLPTAEGQAESYVVRLSDPAGRPLAGADVLLLADMADGTVENVMLGAGSEPGTYTGMSQSGRSVPVDFRLRVSTSDKRIEIPLRP